MMMSESKLRRIIREETSRVLREQTQTPAGPAPAGFQFLASDTGEMDSPAQLDSHPAGSKVLYNNGGAYQPVYVKGKDGWWYFEGDPTIFTTFVAHSEGQQSKSPSLPPGGPSTTDEVDIKAPGPYIISRAEGLIYVKRGGRWCLDAKNLSRLLRTKGGDLMLFSLVKA